MLEANRNLSGKYVVLQPAKTIVGLTFHNPLKLFVANDISL